MENLNEVVKAKIAERLQKGMVNAQAASKRLIEEGKIAHDFIYEVGTENKGEAPKLTFHDFDEKVTGRFVFMEDEKSVSRPYKLHKNAIGQLTQKLGLPGSYIMDSLAGEPWERQLAFHILNMTNAWKDRSKIMARAVGQEIRAIVSDQFLRLDSAKILDAHIEEVYKNGGQLSDGYMDDLRVMIESIYPEPIRIDTVNNGIILVAFGVRWATSDYGLARHTLSSFILQGICLNGAVTETLHKQKHLGAKLPENITFSDETYRLDTETTKSAIRDITRQLYSSDVIKDKALRIQALASTTVESGEMLDNMRGLGKLLKGEVEEIGRILLRNDPMDGVQGMSTLWKLSQGISAYAQKSEVDPLRRMDLEELAGSFF